MKLYRTEYLDFNTATTKFTWQGTQADAAAKRKELKAPDAGHKDVETRDVEVPTDKAGLLEFLNKNCTGE